MRKFRLLAASMLALAGVSTASAQVTAPKLPIEFFNSLPAITDTVWVYNVKAEKFLVNGNDYGTRASLGTSPIPFVVAPVDTTVATYGQLLYNLWNKTPVSNGTKDAKGYTKMFVDNTTELPGTSFLDEAAQGKDLYHLIDMGGGEFQIQANPVASIETETVSWTNPTDANIIGETRMGWNSNGTTLLNVQANGTKDPLTVVDPLLGLSDADAANYGLNWKFAKRNDDAVTLYQAKLDLYNLIIKVQAEGIDVSEAVAVYNNSSATPEELKAATKALNAKYLDTKYSGASATSPMDMTDQIKNADCASLDGWTATVADSHNWAVQSASYTNGDVTIQGFIERWVAGPAKLANSKISQELTLPNGIYSLECDAIAVQQSGEPENSVGTFLFAKSGEFNDSVECKSDNGKPEHFKMTVQVSNNTLQLGYAVSGTTCNWIAVDNFKLVFYGNDATAKAKQDMAEAVEKAMNYAQAEAYEPYLEALAAEIEKAENLANPETVTTEEEIKQQLTALDAAIKTITDNIAAYEALQKAYDKATEMRSGKYSNAEEYPVITDLISYMDDMETESGMGIDAGISNHDWPTEKVNEINTKLNTLMKDVIYSGIKAGNDISDILADPSFDNGGKGEGFQWNGLKTVDATWHNCEAWNSTLDTYQELSGLPNGKYTIKLQGFQRPGNPGEAFTQYQGGNHETTAFIYANSKKQNIKNIFDEKQDARIASEELRTGEYEGKPADWMIDSELADATYVPNSMWGAMVWMKEGHYANEVSAVVTDGNLRFGIRSDKQTGAANTPNWVIFDNFQLIYDGDDINAYKDIVSELVTEVDAVKGKPMNADSLKALTTALSAAQNETDAANMPAKIDNVYKALNAANNSIEAYKALVEKLAWSKKIAEDNGTEPTKAAYTEAYTNVENKMNAGLYADKEIADACTEVKRFTTTHIVSSLGANATSESPADVTAIIENADNASLNGWTNEVDRSTKNPNGWQIQNNGPYSYQDAEGNVLGTIEKGVNFFEMWIAGPETLPASKLSQKLVGLPQGTYRLTAICQAAQQSKDVDEQTGTYLELNKGEQNNAVTVSTVAGKPEVYTVDAYVGEGEDELTIAFENNEATSNWVFVHNFKLVYTGKENTTTAIQTLNNGVVTSRKVYNINGTEMNNMRKGVNIVKTTMADGSVKVQKIIRK